MDLTSFELVFLSISIYHDYEEKHSFFHCFNFCKIDDSLLGTLLTVKESLGHYTRWSVRIKFLKRLHNIENLSKSKDLENPNNFFDCH